MDIKTAVGEMIFAPIDTILSIIGGQKKLVFTSLKVDVRSKKGKKRASVFVHFIFLRESRYTKIFYFIFEVRFLHYGGMKWTQSGNNDGPLELISGIESPIHIAIQKTLDLFKKGVKSEDYEISISWLMGKPEILEFHSLVRLNQAPPYTFRIE